MALSPEQLSRLPAGVRAAYKRFDVSTQPRSRIVTVGITRTTLFSGNPNRVYGFAMNRAVGNGAVDFDAAITFASSMFVQAQVGTLELDPAKIGELVGYEWYAIMDAAPGDWRVWEVVGEK